jgi:hypothetical protein
MMRSRVTTRVVTFVLIALTTTVMSVLQVIPAQASHTLCGRHSWVRSTVLNTAQFRTPPKRKYKKKRAGIRGGTTRVGDPAYLASSTMQVAVGAMTDPSSPTSSCQGRVATASREIRGGSAKEYSSTTI